MPCLAQRPWIIARANGLEPALLDRLALTPGGVEDMAEGLEQIVRLPDPIGAITDLHERPSGIRVGRMRVPLGVIGIIYESRPNVTADSACLCLKTGNAVVLRGGSMAIESNIALTKVLSLAAEQVRHERRTLADRLREDYSIELAELTHEPSPEEAQERVLDGDIEDFIIAYLKKIS